MQQKCSYYCNILPSEHWVRFILDSLSNIGCEFPASGEDGTRGEPRPLSL